MYIDSTMETQRSHIGIWSFFKIRSLSEIEWRNLSKGSLMRNGWSKWHLAEKRKFHVSCRMQTEGFCGAPSCKGFLNTDMKGEFCQHRLISSKAPVFKKDQWSRSRYWNKEEAEVGGSQGTDSIQEWYKMLTQSRASRNGGW